MIKKLLKLLKDKNRSKNTIKMTSRILDEAQIFIKKPLEDSVYDDLDAFFTYLRDVKGMQAGSIELYQRKIIQFFNFCFNQDDNPKYHKILRKLKQCKLDKTKPYVRPQDILTPDEIKLLINVATLERDRCIVAVLYESGMRIGEFVALTNEMVEMDELKQHVIFHIPNMAGCKTGSRNTKCAEVYGYVQDWQKCNPSDKFINISISGIRRVVKTLFDRAKIKKPCNLHNFRHSIITYMASLHMTETELSYRFWGIPHSSMVSVYIHLNEEMQSEGYLKAKGLGNSNGSMVVNPLASRCVNCGKLIQSGKLCKLCEDSKKLLEENENLSSTVKKLRVENQDTAKRLELLERIVQPMIDQLNTEFSEISKKEPKLLELLKNTHIK
ncbi:MAG: tyrosine-type recombinase/integrase [Euryarchaeota archaeon]|nr:tyrosine-type recombinase/integrase [Euryarchaeota archaeon]MCG2737015.1 tyrosine-type recombinase/integrase [Candidatus Methanoperedenaceae archaeon]